MKYPTEWLQQIADKNVTVDMGQNTLKHIAQELLDTRIRAERAESELAKMREENRWRKYPEEKPEDWEWYDVTVKHGDEYVVMVERFEPNRTATFMFVTAWKPRPEPYLPSAPEVTEERWADE